MANRRGRGRGLPGNHVGLRPGTDGGTAPTDAADFATLLRFIAGPGQTPGTGTGQLPAGYLPLTAANHLGAQAAYTLVAADAVAAQNGQVPPLVPQATPPPAQADGVSRPR